eukprot:1148694-Rhodomonas_salina.3
MSGTHIRLRHAPTTACPVLTAQSGTDGMYQGTDLCGTGVAHVVLTSRIRVSTSSRGAIAPCGLSELTRTTLPVGSAISLRAHYAMPSTAVAALGAMGPYVTIGLCTFYAMSSTEMPYAPTSGGASVGKISPTSYASATRCPVLTERTALSVYACAMRCPVLTYRLLLPGGAASGGGCSGLNGWGHVGRFVPSDQDASTLPGLDQRDLCGVPLRSVRLLRPLSRPASEQRDTGVLGKHPAGPGGGHGVGEQARFCEPRVRR